MPRDLFADTESVQATEPRDLFAESGIVPEKKSEISRGEAAISTLTNPLGTGPRVKAGIAAATAKLFGGDITKNVSYEDLYNEALGKEQSTLEQARKEYPIQSLGTGLAADIGVAGKALKAIGLGAPTIGNAVKGGGALTGITTLGETKDLTNIPQVAGELATNIPIGAATGGLIAKAAPAITSIPNKIIDKFTKTGGERLAERAISPQAAKEGLTTIKQAGELPTVGLDISSPEFQRLLKTSVGKYPQAKQIAAEFTSGRKDQAITRLGNALSKDVSPVENAFKATDDLIAERTLLSQPLYEKAYAQNLTPLIEKGSKARIGNLNELIGDERVSNAIKTARKDFGINQDTPDVSVPTLHGARQVVDDIIATARNAGENNKARSYTDLRNKINNVLYEASPTLKQADEVFAGKSKLINAAKEGMTFDKIPHQELTKKMEGFSSSEKDAFRIGARQSIQNTIEKSIKEVGKSTPAEAVINKLYGKNQIKSLFFGNDKNYTSFIKKLGEEVRYNQTIDKLGLNTASVEESSRGIANLIGRVASFAVTGSKPGIVFEGTRAAETAMLKQYKGLNKKTAKELITAFTDKEHSIKILNNIIKKADEEDQSLVKKIIDDVYPSVIGAYIGTSKFVNEASANEDKMSEGETLQQRRQVQQQVPSSYPQQDLKEVDLITKNRLYR